MTHHADVKHHDTTSISEMSEDGDDELFEFENISITRHGDRGGTSSQSGVSTAGQYSPRPPRRRSTSTRSERDRKAKRQHKKRGKPGKAKSQHSLDHLSTRVSELLSIFESKGWYIPLPDSDEKKGKQWSNRNYGADKKRQRKANERQMIEARIQQLERVLRDEYDYSM